ncbi:hypothetical protein ABVK25_008270 [Lepraria finkii]|uniref:Uncharacterized protein n=1 Tax=Lepraria finkii TaxID=1340010 RepID=A0ABR4B0I2_9LECA
MIDRLLLTIVNIFFPPLTVFLITGPYADTLVNCCLFICGIIPSHIYGFYISCTYFHRKNKVRKGKRPGGLKSLVLDETVWNGGASEEEIDELREKREEKRRWKRGSGYDGRSQGYMTEGSRASYREPCERWFR